MEGREQEEEEDGGSRLREAGNDGVDSGAGHLLIVRRGRGRDRAVGSEAKAGGAAAPQEAQQASRQIHRGGSFLCFSHAFFFIFFLYINIFSYVILMLKDYFSSNHQH